jgi:release factor glutamine methyltransferase
MSTIGEVLLAATQKLVDSPSPRLDAELLLMRLLGVNRAALYARPEFELPADVSAAFFAFVSARGRGLPVAYLTGEREFFSRAFRVSPDVLIPRPDTESLIEAALQLKLPAAARVLDLGTGSGAIAVTLALECPDWDVTAVDASEAALVVARDNAARLNAVVRFARGDWYDALVAGDRFDLVISNPPYIAAQDAHLGQGDVRFEPRGALVAGEDGLADIRRIIAGASAVLADGGWLMVEHGHEQGVAVRELAVAAGFRPVRTQHDLAGRERFLLAGWRQPDNPHDAHHA